MEPQFFWLLRSLACFPKDAAPVILDIDPKVDYAFKHVFGRESTRPILIHVINSVLNPVPGHQVRDIELLNPFNPKEAFDSEGDAAAGGISSVGGIEDVISK